jgi:putative heme iron utilization protein
MKFAFELNLHDIYYKLVYEKIKDLDSHFDKIVEDMREWWGKMVIVMSEYQKKLEKRSFDID